MQNTLYIPIDTTIDNPVECEKLVKRGDTVVLNIKVFNNGSLTDLTGQSIDLILKKSDGTLIQKEIDTTNISNGTVTAKLDIQATVVAGLVSGELQLSDSDGQNSTNTFTFNVSTSIADNVIEISKNDINILNELRQLIANGEAVIAQYEEHILAIANSIEAIEALQNIKSYIDTNLAALESNNAQAVVNINNLKAENDKAPTLATNLKAQNDTATSNISTLTTKNQEAVTNKNNIDSSISTANASKIALDTSKTNADNTKSALDTLNTTANNTKDNLNVVNQTGQTLLDSLENFEDQHADVTGISNQLANVNAQLSEKANNTHVILSDNTEDMYLGIFFDDSAEYNNYLYASKNGEKFTRLSNIPAIIGRSSPSLIYYNGTFYCLIDKTGMTTTLNNFAIYTSKNLKDWTLHDIALGDVVQGNNCVYGSDWFLDDNGKIYITYSKQIGYMSDGTTKNFRQYIVEVTDLENLEFSTPISINLDDYNRIDTTIAKNNGTYYLFTKKEITEDSLTDGTISIWTSTDLTIWTKQTDAISSLVGYKFEGPCVCNVEGTWYLYVDNWDGSLNGYMHYCTSSDLINWSAPSRMQTMSRLRHGSVVKVDDVLGKKVINNFFTQELLGTNNDALSPYNKYFNGVDLTSSIANKYIELFKIDMPTTWTAFNIKFKITDTQNSFFNSEFILCGRNQADLSTLTNCVFKEVNNFKGTLANALVVVSQSGVHKVFLNIGTVVSATPTVSVIDFEAHPSISLDIKNSNPVSALPSGTQTSCTTNTDISSAINTLTGKLRLSKTYPSLANTTVTLSFYGLNGVAKIIGHANGYTESQMIDYNLMLLNGNIALVKMDTNGATISATKNSYSNLVYNLTITVPAQYSVIDITLPVGSYFIS